MTSRWWMVLGTIAVAAAMTAFAAGCGGDKPNTLPTFGPPVFPSYSPRPVSTTPPVVAAGCTASTPVKVPVNRGWEATYTICGNRTGTQAVITNTSSGVLHIAPGTGSPQLRNCLSNPSDLVATMVNRMVPLATDPYGAVLVRPGGCALVSSTGSAGVRINLDYSRSGAIFLASSFTKYALNKVGYNRAQNFLGGVEDCANSANVLWRVTGSTPPPVSTVLTNAVGGYYSCKSVLDTVNRTIGTATEARAETTGLLAAAEEIGSGLWEDVLKLAISDPHLLNLLPK